MDDVAASREEAETALRQGDWASVSAGLRWFQGNAEGPADFALVVEQLRYPNLVPMKIAARTLIRRYGALGLSEVIKYLVSDDIEANAHEQIFGVLEELYMEEDVPVRDALLSMIADERYVQLWPVVTEILGEPRLAQGLQGVLKPQ